MSELFKIDSHAIAVNALGEDIEADRRLRVLLLPQPYLHSGDNIPDVMRYALVAEPPISPEEAEAILDQVADDEDLTSNLDINRNEGFGQPGFTAVHGGVQGQHLERGAKLVGIAAEVLGVGVARIIFHKLVHNDDLELLQAADFDDDSDYHIEPRHYLYIAE